MTRAELIDKMAEAMARKEGFYDTEAQCRAAGNSFPNIPQSQANPGNIRRWSNNGPYPTTRGYVDFVKWAKERGGNIGYMTRAKDEGWRVLKSLIGQYIDGKYTAGKPPNMYEMLEVYAPKKDGNRPREYAEFVAKAAGVSPDVVLKSLISAV